MQSQRHLSNPLSRDNRWAEIDVTMGRDEISERPKMTKASKGGTKRLTVTFEQVRLAAQAFPGVEDSTSYGTPALKVRGKLLARLHQSGECLVLRADLLDREILMQSDSQVFYITDHYRDYPWVLVRFSAVDAAALPDLIERAWRLVAPKSLVAKYGGGKG
jgi:hypothetical protein